MTISSHAERANKTEARLKQAEALAVSDSEVMSGEPCIRGTRVPVYLIGELARAHGVRRTHAMYPFLSEEKIELALLYLSEHPEHLRKDRPQRPRLPKPISSKIVRTKKVRI
jgi:uncharacterized protein (DUF433 family)